MAARASTSIDDQTRACPSCGSDQIDVVRRGYAGTTDTPDQFFTCLECGRTTYEILARTRREMKMDRIEPGRTLRHAGGEYTVRRILQAGDDELLVYLKPSPVPNKK